MFNIIFLVFLIFFTILLVYLTKKKNFLLSYTGEFHQTYASNEKIPLIGGIIICISFFFLFFDYSTLFLFTLISITILGVISDINSNFSPRLRLVIQSILIILFVTFSDIKITDTRILFLDQLLSNPMMNYFFVSFCLLILVNGTNFIDGLNTNVIGYYLIISFFMTYFSIYENLGLNYLSWKYWIISLLVVYTFNFFKRLFLGDSGSFILAFIYGFFLIKFYNISKTTSPFFIILLLWYPCFEMLFSIIRKKIQKKSPFKPDTDHLHQLILGFLKGKKLIIKKKYLNTVAGTIINFYNFFIIFLSFTQQNNSIFQLSLITLNIIIYSLTYIFLFRSNKK
ncbi:hypothetical protein [Candidatus Pelagibacter sp.]|uniref:hypothetical protein n=1 Tax=Candidatus Pelagibacter sp. TaxID=2024849 RepID=UPI003F8581D7